MTNVQAAANAAGQPDTRTSKEVMRQFDRLRTIKANLVKNGHLNADASPGDVLAELRRQIPADLF